MNQDATADTSDTRFFGHPRGLGYLAFTEVWERFSFYGMTALLPLYLVRHLLKPENAQMVIGMEAFRAVVESVTGPLTTIAFGAQIFGLYVGAVYLTVLLGSWIGDKLIGRTAAVLGGAVLMAAGHLTMAFEPYFLLALLLLVTGAGLFKGNLVVQIGGLYDLNDTRRTRAFSIYGIAVNLGALSAPLVCGTLGEVYGWHLGFGAAAVGMMIGLLVYAAGMRFLPKSTPSSQVERSQRQGNEGKTIAALFLAFFSYFLIILAAVQAYGITLVWADDHLDRSVFGMQVPVTWVLTWDGIASILTIFLALRIWAAQARRSREPSDTDKMAIAGLLAASAFSILFFSGLLLGEKKTPLLVILLFYTTLGLCIAYLDAPLKAVTTRYAPPHIATTMVGLMLATFGVAHIAGGALGRFYEVLGPQGFWLLNAAIAGSGSALLAVTRRWSARYLDVGRGGQGLEESLPLTLAAERPA